VLDPIDQLEVKLEQPAHEVDDKPQILFAVGKLLGAELGVLKPPFDVSDVVAQRGHALARDLLADEVADQEANQRLTLERCERDRGACVFAQRLKAHRRAWYAITDDEWPGIRHGYEAWLAPENFDGDAQQRRSLGELIREARR
jgi:hypothetical protein